MKVDAERCIKFLYTDAEVELNEKNEGKILKSMSDLL